MSVKSTIHELPRAEFPVWKSLRCFHAINLAQNGRAVCRAGAEHSVLTGLDGICRGNPYNQGAQGQSKLLGKFRDETDRR